MNIDQEMGHVLNVFHSLIDRRIKTKNGEMLIHYLDGNPNNLLVIGSSRKGKTTSFEKIQKNNIVNSAFHEWLLKLPKGSKKPRGKFFWPKRKKLIVGCKQGFISFN